MYSWYTKYKVIGAFVHTYSQYILYSPHLLYTPYILYTPYDLHILYRPYDLYLLYKLSCTVSNTSAPCAKLGPVKRKSTNELSAQTVQSGYKM